MLHPAKLLSELIAIPSVNPAFLPEGDRRAGEKKAGDYLAALADRLGLEVEFQKVFPGRCNVLIRLSPSGRKRRTVMLAPHLDTVGDTSMPDSMFDPVKRQGRLHGRGACDTKGSVAAMFTALFNMAERGRRPAETEILFAGLVDEENGQCGSRAVAASGLRADLAIVGEPTNLRVVTAHKGDLWLRLETRGRSAHGARPELGRNAVHAMARVVDILETRYARQLRKRRHPLLGHATINVGSIRGGTQPNIVPDLCRISVDRRTLPGETERGVRREMLVLLGREGLKVRFSNDKLAECPAMETDPQHPLVSRLMALARQSAPRGVDFFCDAALLAGGGIPSVVCGPGDIAQAHTANEFISLGSLERGAAFFGRYLESLP
jgi:acetylornithine deacetylase/succinyl-diaminopimelate desuccinylase-like protein